MEKFIDTDLIGRIEQALSASGMTASGFGKLAIGDANLLADLRGGRELRRGTRDRVLGAINKLQQGVSEKSDEHLLGVNGGSSFQPQGSEKVNVRAAS